ncbi:MAG: CinA family protein, partial [Planctomycetes bacterium]|nr:CinA family protein [Planctomycetota bacterium]
MSELSPHQSAIRPGVPGQSAISAEVISIGTELTSGRNLDTNSQWLSVELGKIGVPVHYHTTVGDNLDENVAVLRTALERAHLVIITGGLGPTQDDLTREAMAAVAGVGLEFHAPSFEGIQQMFARRNRPMPERNRVQALFPAGSEPIANFHGTAPGIWMWLGRDPGARTEERGPKSAVPSSILDPQSSILGLRPSVLLVAMPGVPSEMYRMFTDQVRPRLIETFGLRRMIVHRKINVFGAGESDVESRLLDLTQRGRQPEVGITVHDATISLRVAAACETEAEAQQLIEPTARTIYERLGKLVFGEGDDELEHVVARMLQSRRLTLATAEGCTGGIVAQRLTAIPGASRWYRGGVVAYAHEIKHDWLDVPTDLVDA